MKKRILLCLAHMSGNEQQFIDEAFKDNWVVPLGPNVNAFEDELNSYLGGDKHVVALSSGTAAVHLSLIASGVESGDEVLCQSFTFCASANPITYVGAKPVFIDSERDSWNIDPDLLEQAILDRKKATGRYPKALMLVYLYGMPANIDKIMEICSKYGIILIEDAAEAFGSRYRGKVCGTFGQYGILSFNGNKMITTSGGGALICPDEQSKRKVMFYATQARESFAYYQHEHIGYNYRMSNICAGIGRGQMTIVDEHIRHHKHIASLYRTAFDGSHGITFHDNPGAEYDANFWLSTIILAPELRIKDEQKAYANIISSAIGGAGSVLAQSNTIHTKHEPAPHIEALRLALDEQGIESRPLWKPMHLQPVFADCKAYTNGVSEELFRHGLCLPSGPYVTDDDAKFVIDTIKSNIL